MDNITKARLKEIINDNNVKCDKTYFHDIIDTYNKDSLIDGRIKLVESDEYDRLCVNVESYELFANFPAYEESTYKFAISTPFEGLSFEELYNFFYTFFIFHEVEHVKQAIYGNEKKHEYEVINDLYELLNAYVNNANNRQIKRYYKNGCNYSFERNANMEASLHVYDLFDSSNLKNAAKVNYFIEAGNGYNVRFGRIICPVEYTLRQFGCRLKLDENEEIPFELAYNHGLFVDPNTLVSILKEYLMCEKLEEIDFDSYKKRIRTL